MLQTRGLRPGQSWLRSIEPSLDEKFPGKIRIRREPRAFARGRKPASFVRRLSRPARPDLSRASRHRGKPRCHKASGYARVGGFVASSLRSRRKNRPIVPGADLFTWLTTPLEDNFLNMKWVSGFLLVGIGVAVVWFLTWEGNGTSTPLNDNSGPDMSPSVVEDSSSGSSSQPEVRTLQRPELPESPPQKENYGTTTVGPPGIPLPPVKEVPPLPFQDWPRMAMEPSLEEIAASWEEDPERWSPIVMPLPDGEEITVEIEEVDLIGESGGSFDGRVVGEPGSSVRLSFRGGAESGMIRRPEKDQVVRIIPDGDGVVRMKAGSLSEEEAGGGLIPAPPPVASPPLPSSNLE